MTTTISHTPVKPGPMKTKLAIPQAELDTYQQFLQTVNLPQACKLILTEILKQPMCVDHHIQEQASKGNKPRGRLSIDIPNPEQRTHLPYTSAARSASGQPVDTNNSISGSTATDKQVLQYFAHRLRQIGKDAEEEQWMHIRELLYSTQQQRQRAKLGIKEPLALNVAVAEDGTLVEDTSHHTAKWHQQQQHQRKEQLIPEALTPAARLSRATSRQPSRVQSRQPSPMHSPMSASPLASAQGFGRNKVGSQIWTDDSGSLGLPSASQSYDYSSKPGTPSPKHSYRKEYGWSRSSLGLLLPPSTPEVQHQPEQESSPDDSNELQLPPTTIRLNSHDIDTRH